MAHSCQIDRDVQARDLQQLRGEQGRWIVLLKMPGLLWPRSFQSFPPRLSAATSEHIFVLLSPCSFARSSIHYPSPVLVFALGSTLFSILLRSVLRFVLLALLLTVIHTDHQLAHQFEGSVPLPRR